ncbi:hypothetical protein P3T27_002151 [Kitasatospora sp. MAA19]|uniref:hypothetical protein n=1 Tax=Kitasatospora sp. MAA19 TaxID=3035090 RepID=UPI00247470BC|nr:hypothetical protein [Kitasatospora sp. MAA19]MDH6705441.1 hypothetical protein [Kitasatospora sp. MAA19]
MPETPEDSALAAIAEQERMYRALRESLDSDSGESLTHGDVSGLLQIGGAVVPMATAASVIAKAKIEAKTERQRIAAETQRAETHEREETRRAETRETAEVVREAIRAQVAPPAVQQGPTQPPTT